MVSSSRMSFCSTDTKTLTDTDLSSIYGNSVNHGLLTADPYPTSYRDTNGVLTNKSLETIVKGFVSQGVIPMKSDEAGQNKLQKLITSIKEEYCFYDTRYKYSLQKLLDSIQKANAPGGEGQSDHNVQTYLQYTQRHNQRINDLTQITNAITQILSEKTSQLSDALQKTNTVMLERAKKLEYQNSILSSHEAGSKLNKQIVQFTEEKARYTNNLLKLYSFLNIVALGLLVYVYRSAS